MHLGCSADRLPALHGSGETKHWRFTRTLDIVEERFHFPSDRYTNGEGLRAIKTGCGFPKQPAPRLIG